MFIFTLLKKNPTLVQENKFAITIRSNNLHNDLQIAYKHNYIIESAY